MPSEHTAESERAKYQEVWSDDRYREFSPAEFVLPLFFDMNPFHGGTLIDLGCGTGRAGVKLKARGWYVTLADFVDARDPEAKDLAFVDMNLFEPWKFKHRFDFGFCCDVLEHMPPEKVDTVLTNMKEHCNALFASIHFGPDVFRKGHLHLTVWPFQVWRDKLSEYGEVVDARDLMGMGVFKVRFR